MSLIFTSAISPNNKKTLLFGNFYLWLLFRFKVTALYITLNFFNRLISIKLKKKYPRSKGNTLRFSTVPVTINTQTKHKFSFSLMLKWKHKFWPDAPVKRYNWLCPVIVRRISKMWKRALQRVSFFKTTLTPRKLHASRRQFESLSSSSRRYNYN